MGSVATSLLDFRFERLAGHYQRLDSFHDDGLLGGEGGRGTGKFATFAVLKL